MKNSIEIWWLKTDDNIDVCGDGKGNYSLEYLPDCTPVEFREGEHADDDMEILREEISKLLGVRCHWVRGRIFTDDLTTLDHNGNGLHEPRSR